MLRTSSMIVSVLGVMVSLAGCAFRDEQTSAERTVTRLDHDAVPVDDGEGPDGGGDPPPDAGVPDPDAGDETPDAGETPDANDGPPDDCFSDLLAAADVLDAQLRQDILPPCEDFSVPTALAEPITAPTPTDPPVDGDHDRDGDGSDADGADGETTDSGDPRNCGHSDDAVLRHDDALAAFVDFQATFRDWLESQPYVYVDGELLSTGEMLACLDQVDNPPPPPPPPPPPAPPPPPPVCSPANTEYNCKGLVFGGTKSYYSSATNYPFRQDSTRGTTCTDTYWSNFFWTRINAAPWNQNGSAAQILARAYGGTGGALNSFQVHTSCHRETESIRTKYRLMLEPKATIVPRWVWNPRTNAWEENNHNFGSFQNANREWCSADCLAAGEGARKFRIGASVRPKLSAIFGGLTKSPQEPDGYWDFGNNTTNYLSQVTGTMHCFGPGTLYTAQDTFTTLPSDVPMPFDAQIAPDCTITTNASVNGSISYAQQGQQPQMSLGVGGQAGQQTVCKRSAGSEIRMSLSCNMAEGAGFANFRTADIDMPAHATACINNGRCSWLSMSIGNQAANKLDLGYWFEQLVAIGRASPADGDNWAHTRRAYAHFRRGGWQYDPANPDWPGSWANHRHAWEGNACKIYKVTNEATGATEALGEDKAICVFQGQSATDAAGAPGAPTLQPNVMLWPYSNRHAQWDPELGRPATAQCTENAHCASGNCNAGRCQ